MNSSSRPRPFAEVTLRALGARFGLKMTTYRAPAIYLVFTTCCACHEKWRSNIIKCCACHEKWHYDITKCCACHEKWLSWLILLTYETWLSCHLTELLLYWAVNWVVILLSCYCTDLLFYWAVTWLNCCFAELLLDWTATLLSCYLTELLLYWAATWLNCYFTELLLDWTVTLLTCCFTELLLYWAVTLLNSVHFLLSVTRKFLT